MTVQQSEQTKMSLRIEVEEATFVESIAVGEGGLDNPSAVSGLA